MKNKLRYIAMLLAVVLCMAAFSVPAFASDGDPGEQTGGIEPHESHHDEPAETTQTVTVNVVVSEDGSRTVTIGDQTWHLDADPNQTGKVVNVNSYLHLRTGPSNDYSIIGHLLNGTEVEVIGESGGWYEIVIPEQTGYVCGRYLEVLSSPAGGKADSENSMDELLEILLQYYAAEGTASAPLTPDGNLTLVDDVGSVRGAGKQFITVESKAGNAFYIIIDRDDKGNENVHFLNLVDEADLMALTEDGEAIIPSCICTDKCAVGAINTNCPVCRTNMTECQGKETVTEVTVPEPTEPVEDTPEKGSGGSGIIAIVLLLVLAGGGALYWFKLRKPKTDTRGSDDLDDYDYGEEDDDEDYEYETETEDDVNTQEDEE